MHTKITLQKWCVGVAIITGISILSCSKSSEPEITANRPPGIPAIDTTSGCPPDGSTGRSITPTLAWTCVDIDDDSLYFDVHFGIASDTVPPLASARQTETTYAPDTLEYEMLYDWMIVARDQHGAESVSPVWSFTTQIFSDEISPTVTIDYPFPGESVMGKVEIVVEATDNDGVLAVQFYIDNIYVHTDSAEPFTYMWDVTGYAEGSQHTIYALASDAAGNTGQSATITVSVIYDTTPPEITLVLPLPDEIISDTIYVAAEATDNDGIAKVDFYINEILSCSDSTHPYVFKLAADNFCNGSRLTIFARAWDESGNSSNSNRVNVTVANDNRPPQTTLFTDQAYVNAVDENSIYPGIHASWEGYDIDDLISTSEFEWRLFGPFIDTTILYTVRFPEECIYDPAGDSYICTYAYILDTSMLPPVVNDLPQPLVRSQGLNYDIDPKDVWVTDLNTNIYDVYSSIGIDTTSQYKFVFWVRTRDSELMADPTPAFSQFIVYEPMFEHSVAVLDETGYDMRVGRWAPRNLDSSKAILQQYVDGAGYHDFDTTSGTDYFFKANRKNIEGDPVQPALPTLFDIFSHRIIIYYNDDSEGALDENPAFGMFHNTFLALDAGASVWLMSRNMGNGSMGFDPPGSIIDKSQNFQFYFGMRSILFEGWLYDIFYDTYNPLLTFNEQFIGAHSGTAEYPHLNLDFNLLESRYPRFFPDTSHVMEGLPEIGIGVRDYSYTTPLYLYLSRHGDSSIFHGKVCAITQDREGMRSACWLFTPLAMDPTAMQQAFATTLEWLIDNPKSASLNEIENRRERIRHFLHYLSHQASPQERESYGIKLRPFQLSPEN